MKLDNIREFLYNRYIQEFLSKHPNVITRYRNNRYNPQEQDSVIINLTDEPVTKHHMAVGTNRQRLYGALIISASAPKDSGTGKIRDYLGEIEDIYWGLNAYVPEVGYIIVESISYNTIEEYRGFYTLAIAAHYRIDGC
jgi:hypothetical protein